MAAPTTTPDLLSHLRKCGLVAPADVDAAVAAVPADAGPRALLDFLVEGDRLTPFQADRLAIGKYKGFLLGGYVILDKLGGGGMGQVFLAEHRQMRRLVALKVLSGTHDGVARERFLREARAAAALKHPNIVGVHDLRTDGPVYYLVMEYVAGLTLQQLVSRHGAVNWRAAAEYAKQVAEGLQHAHDSGLVHRDVKPANLLIDRDGRVRVLDLGLVRSVIDPAGSLTGKVDKAILGTADYLAPEQAVNSSKVDARADIYSLGATLYFLLAGRPVFPSGRTAQKLMWQQLRQPTPIRELVPEVPEALAAVLHKALEKDPDRRFPKATDMAAALAALQPGPVPPPDPAVMPAPFRRNNMVNSESGTGSSGGPSSGSSATVSVGSGVRPGLADIRPSQSALFDLASMSAIRTLSDTGVATPLTANQTPLPRLSDRTPPVEVPALRVAPTTPMPPPPGRKDVRTVRTVTRADVQRSSRKWVWIAAGLAGVVALAAAGWFALA